MGIGATVFKCQVLASVFDGSLPLKVAGLGYIPFEMVNYFVEIGLTISETYITHYDRIECQGHKIKDIIEDCEYFITSSYKYLLIVSPAESEMRELAVGMISHINRINLEYHMIILSPFPFEGKLHHEQTEKFLAECNSARSIRYVEMTNVIEKYGDLNINDAFLSLYDDLLIYVKNSIYQL